MLWLPVQSPREVAASTGRGHQRRCRTHHFGHEGTGEGDQARWQGGDSTRETPGSLARSPFNTVCGPAGPQPLGEPRPDRAPDLASTTPRNLQGLGCRCRGEEPNEITQNRELSNQGDVANSPHVDPPPDGRTRPLPAVKPSCQRPCPGSVAPTSPTTIRPQTGSPSPPPGARQ